MPFSDFALLAIATTFRILLALATMYDHSQLVTTATTLPGITETTTITTPLGYLTFTVSGPAGAVWSESDQNYGLNPDASQNCSRLENFSGQAEGACVYTFGTRGQYIVSVGFVDTDGNYGYPAPISTTLNVG